VITGSDSKMENLELLDADIRLLERTHHMVNVKSFFLNSDTIMCTCQISFQTNGLYAPVNL
jgi:hypothetical protein